MEGLQEGFYFASACSTADDAHVPRCLYEATWIERVIALAVLVSDFLIV